MTPATWSVYCDKVGVFVTEPTLDLATKRYYGVVLRLSIVKYKDQ